jgi:two-component system, NtrC family, nitrogen regulation response regulator NtrX
VSYFMEQISQSTGLPQRKIGSDAMAVLQSHDWPGNVRQLRNIIERTIIMAPGDKVACIDVDLLPAEVLESQGSAGMPAAALTIMGSPLREARESFEREYLKIQIRRFSGNISRTASFIGMERSALHRKLKALGIGDKREAESEENGG